MRLLFASLTAIAVSIAAPSASPAAGKADQCLGSPATIVGDSWVLTGTEGPDVIITNGAGEVDALGGDDLVCVTGPVDEATINTGEGNDRVDSTGVSLAFNMFFTVALGPGADELIGGPQSEGVFGNQWYGDDDDRDVISTGDGQDGVVSGGTVPNLDVIRLGARRDHLDLSGDGAQARVWGGQGRDVLSFRGLGTTGAAITVDNREQRATRDGVVVARWRSFFRFEYDSRGPFTFTGSNASEALRLGARKWPADVRMSGGRDWLTVVQEGPGSRLAGGGGVDSIRHLFRYDNQAPPGSSVLLDLATGQLETTLRGVTTRKRAVRFEHAFLFGTAPATIRGTDGPNRLEMTQWTRVSIFGRAGDDRIRGGDEDDVLIGGPGRDKAAGARGIDFCQAEVRLNC